MNNETKDKLLERAHQIFEDDKSDREERIVTIELEKVSNYTALNFFRNDRFTTTKPPDKFLMNRYAKDLREIGDWLVERDINFPKITFHMYDDVRTFDKYVRISLEFSTKADATLFRLGYL